MPEFPSWGIEPLSLPRTLPGCQVFGDAPPQLQSLCSDSRKVRPGDVFVALLGPESDGHHHVREAVDRGAAAIVAEHLLPAPVPVCVVEDTRIAYAQLCLALAGRPEQQLRLIGVAGSGGKTVTSMLTASILNSGGRRVGVTSSIGFSDSEDSILSATATPSPPVLATWLGRMAANGCHDAVLELDSRSLAERRVQPLGLNAAVLTNLHTARLSQRRFHNTQQAYLQANRRVFEQLQPAGVAIVNADDPFSRELADGLPCPVLRVGMQQPADISAVIVERNRGDQTFLLSAGADSAPVRTRMLGDFHVQNCLVAAATGLALGVSFTDVIRGLEAVDYVPFRLQRVVAGQDHGVFIDASHDPATIARNLQALRQVTPGRLICVFGAHSCDPAEQCAARGRIVERFADWGIATSSSLDGKASLQLMHDTLDGYQRPARAHLMPDRQAALELAMQTARPQDTVLLVGGQAEDLTSLTDQLRDCPADDDGPQIFPIERYRRG